MKSRLVNKNLLVFEDDMDYSISCRKIRLISVFEEFLA
ncbi:catabolite regulation protein CreA [Clostridium saccharobutylicum]|uniref:Uncharacterized protein n=1 Tax=Clostridium saccharobutylicum DSM 13864 TaxID=1345695 RepID=U5MXI1_CLOSA|nr:hypothetical protein CLSA_c42980 [Clostridium saccharobutylicum DSM 13864]MBA2906823.1 catabolite regulation protein CreA [Clostridium saccharobutylicum]MBA8898100.1 catabolite regulation protein CreA [Clostridium saccharobutylicum]MBA8984658.1 catabolite regulation protein CreA [Clostridium saccharobutylicum]MBA8996776.1 catabolite regulation protein CreA [Clostridium saccharobutylicum]